MPGNTYFSIVLVVVLKCVNSVPVNPCPNVFQYMQNNGIVYGRLQFQNDNSGNYELTVNMSLPAYLQTTQNIRLELKTSSADLVRGYPIVYDVYFPFQEVLPKPTKIEFNRRMYCLMRPEEVRPGEILTYIWTSTFNRLPRPSRSSGSNTEIQAVDVYSPDTFGSPSSPTSNSVYFANFPPELQSANSQFILSPPSKPSDEISLSSFLSSLQGSAQPQYSPLPINTPPPLQNPNLQNIPPSPTQSPNLFPFTSFPSVSQNVIPRDTPSTPPQSLNPVPFTTSPTQSPNLFPFTSFPSVSQNVIPRDTPSTPPQSLNPVPFTISPTSATLINSNVDQCGSSTVDIKKGLIHTTTVLDGQFPWLAAILYSDKFNHKYRCTGSLVSSKHVLTAGHCIVYNKALLSPLKDLVLVFGKNDIENWVNEAVLRAVKDVAVHPDYKQRKGDCDIAVITLAQPITFENNIKPVCLWGEEQDLKKIEGSEGVVAGWSRNNAGNEVIVEANKINIPVVSQVSCSKSNPGFSIATSSRTFCAGDGNGFGPCHGNTGAGFVMNRNGRWILRGIVSTGMGELGTCGSSNYVVFVDVAQFLDWLKGVMI